MANIDWLWGDRFHIEIRNEAKKIEKRTGVGFSDLGIAYLVEQFDKNKSSNLLTESRKPSYRQKSLDDARESVRKLLNTAISNAQERDSNYVRRSDLKEAYRIHYCGVWPLCGGN